MFFWLGVRSLHAQTTFASAPIVWPKTLDSLAGMVLTSLYDHERVEANRELLFRLIDTLSQPQAYQRSYNQLQSISRLRSPDNRFQIWTWQLPRKGGFFQHYGLLISPSKTRNRITVLVDTAQLNPVELYKPLKPENWMGCLYYKLEILKYRGKKHYILLGYDQNNLQVRRKVVEVLQFNGRNESSIRFGDKIFETPEFQGEKIAKRPYRLVLQYGADRSAMLRWDEANKRIIMDRLVPDDASQKGQYRFYGPDFSYDALVWKKGKFTLEEMTSIKSDISAPIVPPNKGSGLPKQR